MKRGDVWLVDFGIPTGPEQAGVRPAILLQADTLTPIVTTVIVLPITTNLKRLSIPSSVFIPAGEAGLEKDSVALCHQLQARGKVRLLTKLGELSESRFSEILDSLLRSMSL